MQSDRVKRLIEDYKRKHGKEPSEEIVEFFKSGEPTPFPKTNKDLKKLLKGAEHGKR